MFRNQLQFLSFIKKESKKNIHKKESRSLRPGLSFSSLRIQRYIRKWAACDQHEVNIDAHQHRCGLHHNRQGQLNIFDCLIQRSHGLRLSFCPTSTLIIHHIHLHAPKKENTPPRTARDGACIKWGSEEPVFVRWVKESGQPSIFDGLVATNERHVASPLGSKQPKKDRLTSPYHMKR